MSDAVPVADQFADGRETARDSFFGDHFAIDLNALAKSDEVRGGEEAGAITCARQMASIIAQTEPLPFVPAT